MKVAKVVKVCMTVRVIVDENASDESIIQKAMMKVKLNVNEHLSEYVDSIEPDIENPIGTYSSDNN